MSIIDKAIAAITPPVSQERRAQARAEARSAATAGDWLSQILDHHEAIESAFDAIRAASDAKERRAAQKALGVLLTGHSIAEEAVIYPALAHSGDKAQAMMGYTQQVAAKMQMAALEHLDPVSEDYLDKLGHLEGAVSTHVYEEESGWFMDLKKNAAAEDQALATARYAEEYERYLGKSPEVSRFPSESPSFAADSTRNY